MKRWLVLAAVAAGVGAVWAVRADLERGAPVPPPKAVRWIAAGAGAVPESTQVSIEQDVGLAVEVLGEGGLVLFGAGPGHPVVQVLPSPPPAPRGDPLLRRLGDLLQPRPGRDATYRPTTLPASGAATAGAVLEAVSKAAARSGPPLLVYLAGHGEAGETPADNTLGLWGQSRLSVADLAGALDATATARAVRFVVTTCFSGGFADVAFAEANPERGAAPGVRCGFFSTTWDLEASGCDPNPDRAAQEGYGLHFLHALRGQDRDGRPLPASELDLDGDGRVSLLEAHSRARIASTAGDVPTSTSERWLRAMAPQEGPSLPVALPEEEAVARALVARLGLEGRPGEARRNLEQSEEVIAAATARMELARTAEETAYRAAAAGLLARWPVVDDPWHPDFRRTLDEHGAAIRAHLDASQDYARYHDARASATTQEVEIAELAREAAPYERLARARETQALAGRLAAKGGHDWATYQALLLCERSAP